MKEETKITVLFSSGIVAVLYGVGLMMGTGACLFVLGGLLISAAMTMVSGASDKKKTENEQESNEL